MKTIINNEPTVNEVNIALENGKVVLFKDNAGITFMLNPLGGGVSRTNEWTLRKDFKINSETIIDMVIIDLQ
jgi:hypothetical protein